MGDSGGSVVSVDVERISFGGKVRATTTLLPRFFLSFFLPRLFERYLWISPLVLVRVGSRGVEKMPAWWYLEVVLGEKGLGSRNFLAPGWIWWGCIASAFMSRHLASSITCRFALHSVLAHPSDSLPSTLPHSNLKSKQNPSQVSQSPNNQQPPSVKSMACCFHHLLLQPAILEAAFCRLLKQ
jgi:hypothetical protein